MDELLIPLLFMSTDISSGQHLSRAFGKDLSTIVLFWLFLLAMSFKKKIKFQKA